MLTELREQAQATKSQTRTLGERVTVEQVLDEDIPHGAPPDPISAVCEYCGRKLWRIGMMLVMRDIYKVGNWFDIERCDCDEAREYWAKADEEKNAQIRRAQEQADRDREMERIEILIGKSGMGKRFRVRRFESFIVDDGNKKAHDVCKRYADTFSERRARGEGLFVSGQCGTGKTHLAASIANALLEKGIPVMLLTMQRILDCIKDTYDDDSKVDTSEVIEQFRSCTLLIIDDLGKEQPTGWAQSELYRIINDRYEQMNPVIVTTNYNDDELIKRLSSGKNCDYITSEAIVSRLHEMTFSVQLDGVDRRIMT